MYCGHVGFNKLFSLGVQVWTYRQNGPAPLGYSLNHDCKNDCTCRMKWNGVYQDLVMDPGCPVREHSQMVTSVAISADGKRVVSGSTDNHVKIWDVETGAQASKPHGNCDCERGSF